MKTSTRRSTSNLTVREIVAGLEDASWGGYGYLGERSRQDVAAIERGDRILLEQANARGWTPEQLFLFLDSRVGRHFGDLVFGGWSDAEVESQLRRDGAWYFGGF